MDTRCAYESGPPNWSSEYKEQSFTWLERACQARDARLHWFKVNSWFDSLRPDPRFARAAERRWPFFFVAVCDENMWFLRAQIPETTQL